jgi:hypothetical protein
MQIFRKASTFPATTYSPCRQHRTAEGVCKRKESETLLPLVAPCYNGASMPESIPDDRQRRDQQHAHNRAAADAVHSSLLSFRFPQCGLFCFGSNSTGLPAFSARFMPMSACINGPLSSAAMITASAGACQCGLLCSAFGSFRMNCAASCSVTIGLPLVGIGSMKQRDQGIHDSPFAATGGLFQ